MTPKIVEKANMPPAKCAVTGDIDGPFIDTGAWCANVDPYIYLHVPYVEQLARDLLGMVPKSEIEELRAKVEELEGRVEDYGKLARLVGEMESELEESAA